MRKELKGRICDEFLQRSLMLADIAKKRLSKKKSQKAMLRLSEEILRRIY